MCIDSEMSPWAWGSTCPGLDHSRRVRTLLNLCSSESESERPVPPGLFQPYVINTTPSIGLTGYFDCKTLRTSVPWSVWLQGVVCFPCLMFLSAVPCSTLPLPCGLWSWKLCDYGMSPLCEANGRLLVIPCEDIHKNAGVCEHAMCYCQPKCMVAMHALVTCAWVHVCRDAVSKRGMDYVGHSFPGPYSSKEHIPCMTSPHYEAQHWNSTEPYSEIIPHIFPFQHQGGGILSNQRSFLSFILHQLLTNQQTISC